MYNGLNYTPDEMKQIEARIDEICESLKESLGDRISKFNIAGSLSKHTEVRGLSDVDLRITLGEEYADKTPLQVRRILKNVLKHKIKDCKIYSGDIALTLKYEDLDIQLIPVRPVANGKVLVPRNNESWSGPTDQEEFGRMLKDLYRSYGKDPRDGVYRVEKVIRVMKAMEYFSCAFSDQSKLDRLTVLSRFFRSIGLRVPSFGK